MANKYMEKKWSMSYVIRKIQIETTTIFQNTPVREAQTQNTDSTKCWWGCVVAETLTLLVGIQNGMATWEDHLEVSYKAKHTLTIWFSNHCCCCSVARSCPTLCDPMDFSMPGFLSFAISWVCSNSYPLSQWCCQTNSPSAPNLSQHQGLFQWVGSLNQVAEVLKIQFQHQSFSNHDPSYLPTGAEHFCLHKKLHTDIYGRFIHNCQNLEITRRSVGEWISELS